MNTRVEIKLEKSSQDNNYWLILKKEQSSHGEKMSREDLYELFLKLKEIFKDL